MARKELVAVMGTIKVREANRKQCNVITRHAYRNVLKMSKHPAEKVHHRNMKYAIVTYALEHGIDYSTEVEFNNSPGRADVVYNDLAIAFEVLSSEKLKRFDAKNYPIETIPVPALYDLGKLWAMLKELDALNGGGAEYYRKKITEEIQTGSYDKRKEPDTMAEIILGDG